MLTFLLEGEISINSISSLLILAYLLFPFGSTFCSLLPSSISPGFPVSVGRTASGLKAGTGAYVFFCASEAKTSKSPIESVGGEISRALALGIISVGVPSGSGAILTRGENIIR